MAQNNSQKDKEKAAAEKLAADKAAEEKAAVEKLKNCKYVVKSATELGFKKRNFFVPGINKKVVLIADAEVDEKTYNLFPANCKKVFFKEK